MGDYDFKPKDVLNSRDAFLPIIRQKRAPRIDKLVSDIVGKAVAASDPRLIALVTKWKQAKGETDAPDNFFKDPAKIKELRNTFA